ncbi:hypothetical protein C1H46_028003 [Malus baccata]|uniref:Uncharacterized protein n=1 Tax=Malus baccata TaxID=106549 RepID=A0A540LJ85_MALBA|nr:hypothetical protein C1H46_028003 [Malus baccata]
MELGMPTLVLVKDLEVGLMSSLTYLSHELVSKQEDVTAQLKAERKQTVQAPGIFQRVIKAIPGIDTPDINAVRNSSNEQTSSYNHMLFSWIFIQFVIAKMVLHICKFAIIMTESFGFTHWQIFRKFN